MRKSVSKTNVLKLKYSCGCVFDNDLIYGVRNFYLCKIHYKAVANFNAMHKLIPQRMVKVKKPRWTLIK